METSTYVFDQKAAERALRQLSKSLHGEVKSVVKAKFGAFDIKSFIQLQEKKTRKAKIQKPGEETVSPVKKFDMAHSVAMLKRHSIKKAEKKTEKKTEKRKGVRTSVKKE